ncbi:lipopolysaccharide biosynthesis protein [Methylobacterium organophilum]|uniref:Polysaccharide biosynthesis protein n=1 Tax=Methylobacterium organophilum TaxID=410 RepID=A0ABQ4T6U5_METOR|nr:oligosaccharide flippase family protein [Methylobacterium organophilum]GJE26963.1 hypothetical protein LKMONMHP_1817 [Methylobacterium organophilum]
MIARHTLTYVGSRGVAAALNMASLAVFTRLAPVEVYGSYLWVLSWALLVYGATCQWPKFAFFALYDETRAPEQVGTLVRLLMGMLVLAGLVTAGAAAAGLLAPPMAAAVVAAVLGMAIFEGTLEVARTRLAAASVAASVVARGVLVLGLGSLVLARTGDPIDLVLAVALANALAALPALRSVGPLLRGRGSVAEARRLLAYGWPLVLSFGLAALAQTLDRLIIGKSIGAQELGAYGAIGDFLRQSFVVFGESIALSMISIAKRDARDGGMPAARPVLRDAARALTLVGAFGTVFYLSFDAVLVSVLLGPEYRGTALELAPILVAASLCQMFRAYYFGQVIYFARTSHLDAVASLLLLVVVAGLSLLLIPTHGVMGAAIAVAVGQAVACLAFILGAKGGIRMPVPVVDIVLIVLCALGTSAILSGVSRLPGGDGVFGEALQFALIAVAGAAAAWHFNIIGIADGLARRSRRAA